MEPERELQRQHIHRLIENGVVGQVDTIRTRHKMYRTLWTMRIIVLCLVSVTVAAHTYEYISGDPPPVICPCH